MLNSFNANMVAKVTRYTYLGHIRNPRIYAVPPQLRGFYAVLFSSQKPRKMGGILYYKADS